MHPLQSAQKDSNCWARNHFKGQWQELAASRHLKSYVLPRRGADFLGMTFPSAPKKELHIQNGMLAVGFPPSFETF